MKFNRIATALFSVVIGITFLYGALILWINWPIRDLSLARSGVFGESFGVINTIFSGLAFAGLILTIHLQRHELAESKETFRKERFEDSFYRLLGYYRQNLDDIKIIDHRAGAVHEGVGGLMFLIKKLHTSMQNFSHFLDSEDEEDKKVYYFKLFMEPSASSTGRPAISAPWSASWNRSSRSCLASRAGRPIGGSSCPSSPSSRSSTSSTPAWWPRRTTT